MYVLDSDHLTILQRKKGTEFDNLIRRCSAFKATDFFVTIVSFHEQVNGWTRYIARAKKATDLSRGYTELEGIIESFSRAQILAFSAAAADVYDDLRQQRVNVMGGKPCIRGMRVTEAKSRVRSLPLAGKSGP